MIIMYRDNSSTVSCREVFVKIWAFYTNDPFPGSGPGSGAGWGFHKGATALGGAADIDGQLGKGRRRRCTG